MVTEGRTSLEFGARGETARAGRRGPPRAFRVLVISDLRGDAGPARAPLRERRALRVDVDTLDAVFARIAPSARVELDGIACDVAFESPADLHPDRLFDRLPAFAALRGLAADLGAPGGLERVAEALGVPASAPAAGAPVPAHAVADIERLLGRRPEGPAAPASGPPASGPQAPSLQAWVRGVVAPHVVADGGDRRAALAAAIDAAAAPLMRRVLRAPGVRRAEATWRGVERLVSVLGADPAIELWLLDACRDDWLADVRAAADDLARGALAHHVCGPGASASDGRGWSLVVVDHDFGPGADDVALLAALGSLAARSGAALLAGADPGVAGCESPDALGDPSRWQPLAPGTAALWLALRRTSAAASIALAAPRVLMRAPYGARSDPIERFAFEEADDPSDPSTYVWGCASLALALMAGRAFQADAWALDLDACRGIDDLPAFAYEADGESRLREAARARLPDSAAERLLALGVVPVIAAADRAEVRLPRWQSIADPPAPLRGPWPG